MLFKAPQVILAHSWGWGPPSVVKPKDSTYGNRPREGRWLVAVTQALAGSGGPVLSFPNEVRAQVRPLCAVTWL